MFIVERKTDLLSCVLLFIFIVTSLFFASRGPVWEDFEALDVVNRFVMTGRVDVLSTTLTPYYHPVVVYLIYILIYMLWGHVSFILLAVLNVIKSIGLAEALVRLMGDKDSGNRLLVYCFSFSLIPVGHIFWASAGLISSLAVLFNLAAMHYFVSERDNAFLKSIVCSVLAIYSMPNGFLVFITLPLLAIICIVNNGQDRNYWYQRIIILILIALLAALPYFYWLFQEVPQANKISSFNGLDIVNRLTNILYLLSTPFVSGDSFLNPVLIGLFSILFFFVLYKKIYLTNALLFCYLVMMLLTIGMIGLSRPWQDSSEFIYTGRYWFFSLQAWLSLLLLIIKGLEQVISAQARLNIVRSFFLMVSFFMFTFSYYNKLPLVNSACVLVKHYSLDEAKKAVSLSEESLMQFAELHRYTLILKQSLKLGVINQDLERFSLERHYGGKQWCILDEKPIEDIRKEIL